MPPAAACRPRPRCHRRRRPRASPGVQAPRTGDGPAPMSGVDRTFVALDTATGHVNGAGFHPGQGVYYAPAGRRPRVAMVATHYAVDYSEHYLAEPMARRGIGFLGWNTRYRNNESTFLLEHALVDVDAGVRWLREEAGAEVVVLLGNCGGGSLMAAY